jgi:mannose-6-phosphate isomerase
MNELYPIKFNPIIKDKVWGGNNLSKLYNKQQNALPNIGESWEVSGVQGDLSVVANGFLAGNNIEELIEVYMGDITGDAIYEKFGNEFPLLIKLIEAREDLSIQVHPNDAMAKKRHKAYGKTEMWYILENEPDAKIYTGFKEGVTKEAYQEAVKNGNIKDLLNIEKAEKGDVFFTPAGRVHALGAGITLVEIQQTSDITYRIFDWNRQAPGPEKRELHTDLAFDALDFTETSKREKISIKPKPNISENLVDCSFFTTNLLRFNEKTNKNYYFNDSFEIYICLDGELMVSCGHSSEKITKGETILLPAMIKEVVLEPVGESQILEVDIKSESSL